MSLTTLICAVAEGAAQDVRGNVTVVGVEPPVWLLAPGSTLAPTLILIAEDHADPPIMRPGELISFRVEAKAPDGQTLFFAQQAVPIQPKSDVSLPHRVNMVLQTPLTVTVEGEHLISVNMEVGGQPHEWVRVLRVRLASVASDSPPPPVVD